MIPSVKKDILESFESEKELWKIAGKPYKADETEREKNAWLKRIKKEEKLAQRQLTEDLKNF